jgi:hypothetical protein
VVERYVFARSFTGLEHAMHLTVSLRRVGFKTFVGETEISHSPVYVLVATPKVRPSRKERGL